ncbi:SDR family NAD(P)-dependent oxidoreductase [Balneolaceae bacterium ANBcel3]|nr:SDR family NAD(P)-dependent oxidoreductase [Balneolaceae bacterium ANBcel3]
MKTIVITGASSGIGKATAILFSKKGWNVAATMRYTTTSSLFDGYPSIRSYFMDVLDKDSMDACIQQILTDSGRIEVLVNNAGVYETGPCEGTSQELTDRLIHTNIRGVAYATQSVLPHFRQNKGGIIVLVSSVAGRAVFPFQSLYHMTKWAIEGFGEGLRYELNALNVRVKSYAPGVVKTNLWDELDRHSSISYPPEYDQKFKHWLSYLKGNVEKGTSPEQDAEAIYELVMDNKDTFYYSSDFNTKMAAFLHRFLPVNIFQKMMSKLSGVSWK